MARTVHGLRRAIRSGSTAALSGVTAYGLGYVLVYAAAIGWARHAVARTLPNGLAAGDMVATGLVLYNAHFVDILVTTAIEFGRGTDRINLVLAAGGSPLVLFAIPPLALTLAGAAMGSVTGSPDRRTAAWSGATVVAGYLPAVVAGAFVFRAESVIYQPASGWASVEPNLLTATVLAGVVYPVVFGTLGGLAGADGFSLDWRLLRGTSE